MQLGNVDKPIVLIVDDEPDVATALADVLEDNFLVLMETSPHAALDIIKTDKRISVIVSDQRMPGMTGDELFARAVKVSSATRVLVTTHADTAAVIDAVNQGKIFALVTKPWQPDDIILTVKRAAEYSDLNRKILHERALLHQLMESSVDAIYIKDRDHKYVKLNKYEARYLGADSVFEVEGRTVDDFVSPERAHARHRDESSLLTTGIPIRNREIEIATADGSRRWYSANMSPIRSPEGDIVGMVGITRDVTESKRLDELKDQFIATVRHELRTPLTAIQASLGLLKGAMQASFDDKALRLLDIGHENCGKLLALVGDLLDTVKFDRGQVRFDKESLTAAEFVDPAIKANQTRARQKNVALHVEADLPSAEIVGDRERLAQAVANLIANAIDVSPIDGNVLIRVTEVAGNQLRISVRDQGPGVPADVQPRLFTRFAQADSSSTRAKAGVGLGLHIAKSIIDAHRGRIGFANLSSGAEFYVELPTARQADQVQVASAAS